MLDESFKMLHWWHRSDHKMHLGEICIWILILIKEFENKECIVEGTSFKCEGADIYRIPWKPIKDRANYWILDFKECRNLMLYREDFEGFTRIFRLELSYIPMEKQRKNVSLDIFKDLGKDRNPDEGLPLEFSFEYSGLTDELAWILPPHTISCTYSYNNYTQIDVSSAKRLEILIAFGNKLKTLPIIHNRSTIREMQLHGNPMDDLTVDELVPYCQLDFLRLEIPPGSRLQQYSSKCECMRIRTFMREFKQSGYNMSCAENSFWDLFWECDLTFAEFKEDRMECGDGNKLPLPPFRNWFIYCLRTTGVLMPGIGVLFFILKKLYELYKGSKEEVENETSVSENFEEGLSLEEEQLE